MYGDCPGCNRENICLYVYCGQCSSGYCIDCLSEQMEICGYYHDEDSDSDILKECTKCCGEVSLTRTRFKIRTMQNNIDKLDEKLDFTIKTTQDNINKFSEKLDLLTEKFDDFIENFKKSDKSDKSDKILILPDESDKSLST